MSLAVCLERLRIFPGRRSAQIVEILNVFCFQGSLQCGLIRLNVSQGIEPQTSEIAKMPRKKLKCSRCSRTFSMPAHLARHMNTTHATGAARAARQRMDGRKGKAGRRPGATAVLAGGDVSFTDSADLLSGIQAYHESLLAKRDQIDWEVSALGNALSALGSTQAVPAKSVRQERGRRGAGDPPNAGWWRAFGVLPTQ